MSLNDNAINIFFTTYTVIDLKQERLKLKIYTLAINFKIYWGELYAQVWQSKKYCILRKRVYYCCL